MSGAGRPDCVCRSYVFQSLNGQQTRTKGFDLEEADAIVQHKSIIGALRTTAPACVFEQIAFVVGKIDFYTKFEQLDVQKEIALYTRSFIWEYTRFQTNTVKRGASLLCTLDESGGPFAAA